MSDFIQTQLPLILYFAFCVMAVVSAIGVISLKNPVSSAFSLILVLLNIAGVFAMQEAFFIAAVQVLVYAGAIMVLFVFVIMLLSIELVELDWPASKAFGVIPAILSMLFFVAMGLIFINGTSAVNKGQFTIEAIAQNGGNIRVVSEVMFSDFILPFQIVGMLLSICIVGAVVLAKKRV